MSRQLKFTVRGMSCAACQGHVQNAVSALEGVEKAEVNLLTARLSVECKDSGVTPGQIIEAVTKAGYGAEEISARSSAWSRSERERRSLRAKSEQNALQVRLWLTALILVPLFYLACAPMWGWPSPFSAADPDSVLHLLQLQFFMALAAGIINRKLFSSGLRSIWSGSPNMDALVCVGYLASFLYSSAALMMLWGHTPSSVPPDAQTLLPVNAGAWYARKALESVYFDSCAFILFFVTMGRFLESGAKVRTVSALEKLADLMPRRVSVRRGDSVSEIDAEELVPGDIVVVKSGQTVPADGKIVSGGSYADMSALTGESVPVFKKAGDEIVSASICCGGSFEFEASQVGSDTVLAQIITLVDEAAESKAPAARLADKVSAVFVPAVMGIAFAVWAVWMLCGASFEQALGFGVSVLVVSCPCALGLAAPVALMVGMGRSAQLGILIKNAQSLEVLHSVQAVCLDKTGTLTQGRLSVSAFLACGKDSDAEEILSCAASVEQGSQHPAGRALVQAFEKLYPERSAEKCAGFREYPGLGVEGTVSGRLWRVGRFSFAAEFEKELTEGAGADGSAIPEPESFSAACRRYADKWEHEGRSLLFISCRGEGLAGAAALSDELRHDSAEAVRLLHELGIKTVIVSGDSRAAVEHAGRLTGADEVHAEVMPSGKEEVLRSLHDRGLITAMAGDGINDAPALKRADIGIAVGGGTDIASEAADVVLMRQSLSDIAAAVKLSLAVTLNIKQNLFWAFFYNCLAIPAAAGAFWHLWGLRLTPAAAALAMSLSSFCVVSNALRLRSFKPSEAENRGQEENACGQNGAAENIEILYAGTRRHADEGKTGTKLQADSDSAGKGSIDMRKIITIEGMMCGHCQAHVKKALEALEGVQEAAVSFETGKAEVTLSAEVADSVLSAAVAGEGYKPVKIETA